MPAPINDEYISLCLEFRELMGDFFDYEWFSEVYGDIHAALKLDPSLQQLIIMRLLNFLGLASLEVPGTKEGLRLFFKSVLCYASRQVDTETPVFTYNQLQKGEYDVTT